MNKPYAVVYFINDDNYSEIPSNWLLKDKCTGKVSHCKWPPQQGNLNFRMKNKTTPADDWLIYDVEVIKYCDTLKYARKAAEDSQCSSETDRPLGRGYRKKRPSTVATAFRESNNHLESSDISDDSDKISKPAAPIPKFDISKVHPTQIAEAHALGPEKHEEKATEISDTEESNVLTDKELVSSNKNGKRSGILPDNSIRTTSKAKSMNKDEKIPEHPRSIIPDDFDHENDEERFNTLNHKLDQCLHLLGAHSVKLKDIEQRLLTTNNANPEVNNTIWSEIKEDLPLDSKEEISAFEEKLLSKKYSQEFVKIVKQVGGSNARDCTERVLNLIFSQKFAATNTWEGKKTKYKVADSKLMKICEGAILYKYPFWDSAEFSKACQNWFRLGNQRAGQQPKQVQKKTKPPASEENG